MQQRRRFEQTAPVDQRLTEERNASGKRRKAPIRN